MPPSSSTVQSISVHDDERAAALRPYSCWICGRSRSTTAISYLSTPDCRLPIYAANKIRRGGIALQKVQGVTGDTAPYFVGMRNGPILKATRDVYTYRYTCFHARPSYLEGQPQGPPNNHTWTSNVSIGGINYGTGQGTSRDAAREAAATQALIQLHQQHQGYSQRFPVN
ncbi:hypothetical protein CVT26_003240 [Gymnopilus dilepis]|uniref:DRBM domain-containing protein n=1 Tax=Gymnopilus dilepis TaxID=231916 RepID=A0A409Y579_9AGAR|nr:hypothetical protein CVT26_003240 [Gymnopilus dilepis]